MSSNIFSQVTIDDVDLIDNPQNRCPCVLLLDTSVSMDGAPIAALNAALVQFAQDLTTDSLASKRVEVSIITFGPVQTVQDFVTVDHFQPPVLSTTGATPMGEAIVFALQKLRERVDKFKNMGVPSYRPWIFLITDGAPTDDWTQAAAEVNAGDGKKFSFFGIGVEGADMHTWSQICPNTKKLSGLQFRELFKWIAQSMQTVSRSVPGDVIKLPSTGNWDTLHT